MNKQMTVSSGSLQQAPSVLIINAYSAKNIGDGAIIIATIKILKRQFPNCEINVMSGYPDDNVELYTSVGAKSIPSVWVLSQNSNKFKRYLEGPAIVLRVLLGRQVHNIDVVRNADIVISAGGGYLFSSRKGALGTGFVNALFHIWLGTHFKKPTYIFPKSIGPIQFRADAFLLKRILQRTKAIFVREPLSLDYLRRIGLKNIIACPDIAFSLYPAAVDAIQAGITQGDPKIGITVLDWQFFRRGTNPEDVSEYIDKVSTICHKIREVYPQAHFYIFVQVAVALKIGAESDMPISRKLQEALGSMVTLVPLDATKGGEWAIGLYKNMDLFVASRMHSAIFALCASVPTVALIYQQKTKGTFEMLGLSEYTHDVQAINVEEVTAQISAMITEKNRLTEQVIAAVEKARMQIENEIEGRLKSFTVS
ncbi:colanic acid/amylovoran biosynthesis protein [Abditibacterium utsteinense]|uniref:Colanic acid/amylovoran biosynthesis protein n=2 Tax=Abditibacterium utsteinense TaxID=1960156 RepID=A0A2S8SNW5_9BACT|nr:colanic acid/amylovoran biosynthesis protein [Abditibacterium utsteinense]